jgi:APA family basic amino acid/polyamine antiporter
VGREPLKEPGLRRGVAAAARLQTPEGLRRGLGAPALFGIVQGFLAASIYFVLGLVAERALGLTWVVFLAAAVFFVATALAYVEGASLHRERGGATVIARHGFNELVSFVAGWAILLDYLIVIAITAFATTDYVGVFWDPLSDGLPEFLVAAAVIAYVAGVNIRGAGPRRYERATFLVLADLILQVVIVGFGLALLLEPDVLSDPTAFAGTPSVEDTVFAFTLAIAAFSGLDASSGLAGEVRVGRRGLKRLLVARTLAAIVPYVGIAVVAASTLPAIPAVRQGDPAVIEAPMIGVVSAFQEEWLREPLRYVVAAAALGILVVVCNAAMLGLSRLGYSLAINRQIPSLAGRLHPTRSTPVVVIAIGALMAVALVIPADLEFLAAIYAFGATLAFTLVHLSVCRLRWREPSRDRPYKMPLNVRVRGAELPLPSAIGALVSAAAFVSVVVLHGAAPIFGAAWMAVGVTLYVVYRLSEDKPLLQRVTVPERTLTRTGEPEAQYSSILVPVLGHPLDDDIMQTAGRLAGEDSEDEPDTDGARIEALWVILVPMSLPIDARVSEEQVRRARAALARAKAVGEEYEGVTVSTNIVRARRAGEAIVAEARRKGVEAIVLAAEEPTRVRGGLLLGGKQGLHDTYVGETTRYVVDKAPCRVILTAPPSEVARRDRFAPPPAPDPMRPAGAAPVEEIGR